jgi:hypothetical protein
MHENLNISKAGYHHIVTRREEFMALNSLCLRILGLLMTVSVAQSVKRRVIRCLMESLIFWNVTFCRWVSSSRRFEGRNDGKGVQFSSWTPRTP